MVGFFPWFRRLHPVLKVNRGHFVGFSQDKLLGQYDFIVCDTELTGLDRRRDEIISIGAVRVSNLQIELNRTFHCLVRPENIDPNQATLVHRITPEQLKIAPALEEVLPAFVEFCGNALLVGHFVELDLHFLNRASRKILGGVMANPSLDTMQLARGYKESQGLRHLAHSDQASSFVLDDLTAEFNLPRFKPHDALEDALQTAYLFLFLIKKLRQQGGTTLRDLYAAGRRAGLEPSIGV